VFIYIAHRAQSIWTLCEAYASEILARPKEVKATLRPSEQGNSPPHLGLASQVISNVGIWIKDGEYKMLSEAPLTGEALTAFEAELEKSRWRRITDGESEKEMVKRTTNAKSFCMWARVINSESGTGVLREEV
jgi:hypothetical protein